MKIRTGWFFFFLSMVTVLPYRIYQRLFSLEINMGFPKAGDHTLEILLVLFVLFTILFVWSCFSDKEAPAAYRPRRNIFAGIFALLLSASVAAESVSVLLSRGESALDISKIVLGGADILAVFFFILLAVDSLRGTNVFKNHPNFSLALPVWALVRLAISFMQFNTETGQENMFDSFALIGCLLFLYSQSRLLVGIEREKTLKSTFSYGFLSILTGFMCILPRYIGYILVNGYTIAGVSEGIYREGLTPYPTDLLFSLYVLAFLIGLYFNTYKKGRKTEGTMSETASEPMPVSAPPSQSDVSKTPSYFYEVTGGMPQETAGYYPAQEERAPQYGETPYPHSGQSDYSTPPPPYGPEQSQYPPQTQQGGYEPEPYPQPSYPPHQNPPQ